MSFPGWNPGQMPPEQPGGVPPVPLPYPPSPGYYDYPPTPPSGYPQPGYRAPGHGAVSTNSLAIVALASSAAGVPLTAFCCLGLVPALAGVALGIVALTQINRTGQSGKGLAIGGIAVGAAVLALTAAYFLIIFSV